jgi:hypothetical protein
MDLLREGGPIFLALPQSVGQSVRLLRTYASIDSGIDLLFIKEV